MTPPQLIPLHAYLRESLAFLSSHVYLLTGELAARQEPNSTFGVSRKALGEKIPKVYGDPLRYFIARLFISHIASFEVFLQDTVVLVAQKNPKKVGAANFTLAEVLDAEDSGVLVRRATDEFLTKLMYKKPSAYLEELCLVLSIDPDPMQQRWKIFVEAKARRDLGVHAAWRCNEVYLRKLKEIEIASTANVGDIMLPPSGPYLDATMNSLNELASQITARVCSVHWPDVDVSQLDLTSDA